MMEYKEDAVNKRSNMADTLILILLMVIAAGFILPASVIAGTAAWIPEKVLTEHLKQNFPWDEMMVTNLRVSETLPAEMPVKTLIEKGPVGRAVFYFVFATGKRIMATADVKAFDRVVKSKRPFRKGYVLRAGDVYGSKMEIRKLPRNAVRNPEAVIGKSLKRSVSANMPVVEDMIERETLVKRGQRVMLIITDNGFNIRAAGEIMEKGYVGTPVKVVNLSSRKEVVGILVDENTVEVQL